MSNQLILWSLIVLPWLTLFLLNKDTIKRFMPAAILSMVVSIIINMAGNTLNWWVTIDTAFPLSTLPHSFGLNPIITIWLMHFTYGRFWLFLITDIVINLGFAYLFLGYFYVQMGFFQYLNANAFHAFLLATFHGILLYVYHMWQEKIYAQPYKSSK